MKFKDVTCPNCGKNHDSALVECPHCRTPIDDAKHVRNWGHCTPILWWRELVVFLIGFVALMVLSYIIAYILQSRYAASLVIQGHSTEEIRAMLMEYARSANYQAIVTFTAYGIVAVGLGLFIWKDWKRIGKLFKNGMTYLGFALGVGLLGLSLLWSFVVTSLGFGENANQSTLVELVRHYPALSIIFFVFIGPAIEELAYRLGLFTFLKRVHTAVAYVGTALVFALIHFDFTNIGSATEWINLPSYLISGLMLSFAYDRFGIGASYFAHLTNNLVAVLQIFLVSSMS